MIRALAAAATIACAALILPGPDGAARAQEAVARFGSADARELLLRSTTDIVILRPTIEAFVAANPDLAVLYEQWGSNALYDITRADCDRGTGGADAVFSSAVHQLVDLVNAACASPHRSPLTAALPAARVWRDEIWGITNEAAVTIYNTALVPAADVPWSRFQLLDLLRRGDPRYRGKIATYDIETSGLGYLFAFSDSLEATTFGALLEGFNRNEAVATCCSAEIIERVAEGRYLIAYNVLGSYIDLLPAGSVGVIYPRDYTLFLSRPFMIPRAGANRAAAARLLDFLLSDRGQLIMRQSGLISAQTGDEDGLTNSAGRTIRIEPKLLVARDTQRRASFIAQWRSAFGPQAGN